MKATRLKVNEDKTKLIIKASNLKRRAERGLNISMMKGGKLVEPKKSARSLGDYILHKRLHNKKGQERGDNKDAGDNQDPPKRKQGARGKIQGEETFKQGFTSMSLCYLLCVMMKRDYLTLLFAFFSVGERGKVV